MKRLGKVDGGSFCLRVLENRFVWPFIAKEHAYVAELFQNQLVSALRITEATNIRND